MAFTRESLTDRGPRIWYLFHLSETNPNKSSKVRVVFHTAAEYVRTSLNNNLFQGSDPNSPHCPLKVSTGQQVKVQEQDQDSLQLLWWNGSTDDPPEEYVMIVHIFKAAESACAANSNECQRDLQMITRRILILLP